LRTGYQQRGGFDYKQRYVNYHPAKLTKHVSWRVSVLTVAATGSGALTYQWQKGGANISGATAATYTISSVASGDAANYTCVVTGGCGPVTSNAAALTINTAVLISTQPVPTTVTAGSPAIFTVVASGSGSLLYQWQRNEANISGTAAPKLVLYAFWYCG